MFFESEVNYQASRSRSRFSRIARHMEDLGAKGKIALNCHSRCNKEQFGRATIIVRTCSKELPLWKDWMASSMTVLETSFVINLPPASEQTSWQACDFIIQKLVAKLMKHHVGKRKLDATGQPKRSASYPTSHPTRLHSCTRMELKACLKHSATGSELLLINGQLW